MVLHLGQEDLVALAEPLAKARGDEVQGLGGAPREDNLRLGGAYELRDFFPRIFIEFCRFIREGV